MNVHLLRLSGSPFTMGKTHGKASRDAGSLGALQFYGNFLDHSASFQVGGHVDRQIRFALRAFLGATFERRLVEQIPERYRDMAKGFSEASDLPLSLIEQALVMPDMFGYLLGRRNDPWAFQALRLLGLGCTSFVVNPGQDGESSLLHARNLDFPGGNLFAQQPAVIEYHPETGQRYAAITSLGIDGPGITGINESGLTLALHMNYSKRVSVSGTPIVVIGHEIIRQATNLKEAVEIARQFQVGSGWSFVLTSSVEKNAVVLEQDSQEYGLRGLVDRHLVCTNHYVDPTLNEHAYWHTRGQEMDSRARMKTVTNALTREAIRNWTAEDSRRLLASSQDSETGREKAFVNTVCAAHSLLSVVFDASRKIVHVAGGPCPAPKNGFEVIELFPGPFLRDDTDKGSKMGTSLQNRSRRDYSMALDAYFPSYDLPRAERHLRSACENDPEEELYWGMLGLVQLKQGKVKEAKISLDLALGKPLSEYRAAHHRVYFGRVLDLLGERPSALEVYRQVERSGYFKRESVLGIKHPWKIRYNRKVLLDFILGEGILS